MMDTPFPSIVDRLNHTLENVIAPEIDSPIVRGQLFAVVEILNQIQGRFDYRHDFMIQDIQVGGQMLATVIEALNKAGVAVPEAISGAAEEVDLLTMSAEQLRASRGRVEEAVRVYALFPRSAEAAPVPPSTTRVGVLYLGQVL